MKRMTINEVAAAIRHDSKEVEKPVLIAIDGLGGSGKTTLSKALAKALGDTYVISIDDFIVRERLLEQSSDEVLFDRARLTCQILKPAKIMRPLKYQRLVWSVNELSEPLEIPVSEYLVIEGISSTHPDIAHYFDYKIWIDTPPEVAKERGRQRDAGNENEGHWNLWSANDVAYVKTYHPDHQADFVVENP